VALTIHYNMPAVPMDHSFVYHSYQPADSRDCYQGPDGKYSIIVHHYNTESTR
jgi:hypothetical protein